MKLNRQYWYPSLVVALASLFGVMNVSEGHAAPFSSVSHFHQVKVFNKDVLMGTHEGLFQLLGKNNMKPLGNENFDVMGLAIVGNTIYASGHPDQKSKLPSPVGLISSSDSGVTWKVVSLGGKSDFHLLEGAGSDLYGVDSLSGNLFHSSNLGKNWINLGKTQFSDIAVYPEMSGMAIGLKESDLYITEDAFKSLTKIKSSLKFSQVEVTKQGIIAVSGDALYLSVNTGTTWKKIHTFKNQIGILSANNQLTMVTVGSDIFTSFNSGKTFKQIV